MSEDAALPGQLARCRLALTAQRVRRYAEITEDVNPIHLDRDFAAATAAGVPIAHGTLTLNALWGAISSSFGPAAFAGMRVDIRFLRPVPVGETVTGIGRRGTPPEADYILSILDSAGQIVVEGHLNLPRRPGEAT